MTVTLQMNDRDVLNLMLSLCCKMKTVQISSQHVEKGSTMPNPKCKSYKTCQSQSIFYSKTKFATGGHIGGEKAKRKDLQKSWDFGF